MLDKADQEALIMGLSLHDRGKGLMEKEDYRGALDILLVSEEAFSCCNSSIKHSADNEGLLMLDIVWCYFQLRDAASLGAATERLGKARSWLQRSHGPNLERMKVLHGDFTPELTTYVRLELLEGVGAFHAGDNAKAKAALEGALAKWERLQVSDDRLAELLAMGFTSSEATRGLRFCAGDCERAVGFIMEQRRLQRERKDRQRQERRLRAEQRSYGRCPNGLHVDMQLLERLTLLGYERQLAAEALRQARGFLLEAMPEWVNNDIQVALDILSNPMANASLQQHLATIKQASNKRTKPTVDEVAVASLVSMGFPESDARQALERCAGSSDVLQAAMEYLFSLTAEGSTGTQADTEVQQATDGSNGMEQEGQAARAEQPGPSAAPEHAIPVRQPSNSPGTSSKGSDRDEEMEEELTSSARTDPMSAYDIDVSQEGAAIQEYMALLGSCNV
ncbi:hypothetical protein COCSUDRAFT_48401 [Coccomyxa subellipsoidea C-169]|uniref:UBA domain-containing protein n=1 Tax=Coccomyxa subellipsoidea (strain C-169) TaxID=574566 RepID=I0YQV0_COCSC|nr:hypothetical protein COCSUDRAFT_48401 [Coccomyxa subellipsoidea C-169]EIE20769.1 hypothetical protein COCSUDRAFT_48401 [Coccomyxa subellipsoidea C-169]|eukprot:XP_005645313.1 hypothetical protein COCSUDRAFT_48401 [Coccomyxa subellipsoidea C-169]